MSAVTKHERTSFQPRGRDYGYANARLRGMRSRLLKQTFFDDLMASPDMHAVVQKLMATEYRADLESRLLHGRNATQVDKALKDNIVRTFEKVLAMVNDEAYGLITILLARWDLFNIKTIVRAKHASLSVDEIKESLITVGQLGRVDADELARQQDIRAVVDTLATWGLPFAEPLRAAFPEYLERRELSVLELALDRYYYQWASEQLTGKGENARIARGFLGAQVDTMNLLTALRLLTANLEPGDAERYFIPGGSHLSTAFYNQLVAKSDMDELLDLLKRTPYGVTLDKVALAYIERGSISVLERALEEHLFLQAYSAGRGDPLGVGIAIGYLWGKVNEMTNLRIIVKGVSVGMPAARMREELIVV